MIKAAFIFLALILVVAGLCLILYGQEGAFPQWVRALLVVAALGVIVLMLRERKNG